MSEEAEKVLEKLVESIFKKNEGVIAKALSSGAWVKLAVNNEGEFYVSEVVKEADHER